MKSREPITIARVIARLNVGGPAVQAILLTDFLRRRGYRTLLFAGQVAPGEEEMDYLARERGVVPIRIGSLSRKISVLQDLQSLWQLVRFFRRERPTIVHTHTAKAGTLGRIAAIIAGVPIRVHTFHGHVFHGYFPGWLTRVFITIERLLARHTHAIIAISDSQKEELADRYRIAAAEKIKIVPLGFSMTALLNGERHEPGIRSSLGLKSDSGLVGWIGRLTSIKDPHMFLESAAFSGLQAKFVIVGDGELRASCQIRIAQKKLGEKVVLIGWRRDLGSLYADLDLLVMTSINEGTPLALLEAMAAARPFVATDVGGIRDLMVGEGFREFGWERFENGILTPRDPRIIARAIDHMLQNEKLRRDLGCAGREFVKSRYSEDRLANDLEHLYLQLASRNHCIPTYDAQPTTVLPNSH
jgi:glycosyltransferase involved in cell wall biosynthesis